MVYIVTGGAGYIGGHLVDELVNKGEEVIVIDDFSNGSYINYHAKYIRKDLRADLKDLSIPKNSIIYHLAANPDVKTSMVNIREHFERDVLVTLNVLELARKFDAEKVIFASSSTVYGETDRIPTREDELLKPISNYGLFKLFGELMMEFYSRNYGIPTVSVRLANVTGGRVTHGVIKDFIEKLRRNPKKLEILGNGKQRKSYIYISDTISAFRVIERNTRSGYSVFNVGNEDWITVDEIARIIEEEMGVSPVHVYIDAGDGRGWIGDVRFMLLDISKLKQLGWKPNYSSAEVVRLAVRDIIYGYKG